MVAWLWTAWPWACSYLELVPVPLPRGWGMQDCAMWLRGVVDPLPACVSINISY